MRIEITPSPAEVNQQATDLDKYLEKRHTKERLAKMVFLFSTLLALIFLTILLATVINKTMGYTVIVHHIEPSTLSAKPFDELTSDELIGILRGNLTRNRIRTLEREKLLEDRSKSDLIALIDGEIVEPKVVESYNLIPSLLNKQQIYDDAAQNYPQGKVAFRSWLNRQFLTSSMSSEPELTGIKPALLGSLALILITIMIAFPIGVGAAIYLEEYSAKGSRLFRIIQTNIDNLAGVPSIIYGILGLALFVRTLGPLTSGAIFGIEGGNGRTILSAGFTMALLVLPILIINAQEAIRAVPDSLRQASYGLGATQWQTIWYHVLPSAMPGILTGTILAVSRAIGETAPLIVVGASTFITSDPTGPFSSFTALPIQIYNWTTRPQPAFQHIAAAAILVLVILLLSLNAEAIFLR